MAESNISIGNHDNTCNIVCNNNTNNNNDQNNNNNEKCKQLNQVAVYLLHSLYELLALAACRLPLEKCVQHAWLANNNNNNKRTHYTSPLSNNNNNDDWRC